MERYFSWKYEYVWENVKLCDLIEIMENILHEPESGWSTLDGFVKYYTKKRPDQFKTIKITPSGDRKEIEMSHEEIKIEIINIITNLAEEMQNFYDKQENFDYIWSFLRNKCILIHEILFAKLWIPDPFREKEILKQNIGKIIPPHTQNIRKCTGRRIQTLLLKKEFAISV